MKKSKGWARCGIAAALCAAMILTACSTNWIAEAEQIVAALIPAAANIVTLVAALQGKNVSAVDLKTIQSAGSQAGADLQLVQSLIAAYEKADASARPGILSQIQTAITTVQANLQSVLPALHIQDAATQAKVTAVVGLVVSEVQSLEAVIPALESAPTLATKSAAGLGHPSSASFQAKAPLSANEFVSSYNATLTAKTGNAELDRVTAELKIHAHGKAERVASAGVLK